MLKKIIDCLPKTLILETVCCKPFIFQNLTIWQVSFRTPRYEKMKKLVNPIRFLKQSIVNLSRFLKQ